MRIISYILAILCCFNAGAQVNFKTIVPQEPIILGEAFPVQYVLENGSSDVNCKAPSFHNFRLIGNPSVYHGNNGLPLENTVYTLEAIRPGKFMIEGASIEYNGTVLKSNSATVEVISKADAYKRGILKGEELSNNDLYLKPGEDVSKKINSNLFVRLVTDKQSCYVGEAITATFKLYSRLQSTSDIVKNPGFYGFTVFDVWGLKDNRTEKETVNGKQYDVHIIRKVQLYPLRAGALTIDEMEIENTVVFTDSPSLRKVEQQIIEGVVADKNNKGKKPGTHEYSNSIHTMPVTILVKDIPVAKKPSDYSGATGLFTIQTQLNKKELHVNEQGELIVTLSGKGNFTQLIAPQIEWPAGIEGFEAVIEDTLDKDYTPLQGKRSFHFPFVVAKPGDYSINEIVFSFFNPDTNGYKKISSKPLAFHVSHAEQAATPKVVIGGKSFSPYLLYGILLCILIGLGIFFFIKNKKKSSNTITTASIEPEKQLTVKEVLHPAFSAITAGDTIFYSTLRQCIWAYLTERLGVSTVTNNNRLATALAAKTSESSTTEILHILSETETHTYGGITSSHDKEVLLQHTVGVLEKMDTDFRK